MAIPFLMGLRENQHVFLEKSDIQIPERKSSQGGKPGKLKAIKNSLSIGQYHKLQGWMTIER
jgi:hypothetical protein